MIKVDAKTEVFKFGDYYVEVMQIGNETEAYLWHKDYCVKMMLWGADNIDFDEFVKMTPVGIDVAIYIYEQEYMY